MTKLGRELKPGDRVLDAEGKPLTVKEVCPGFNRGLLLIIWKERVVSYWSSVERAQEVTLADPRS